MSSSPFLKLYRESTLGRQTVADVANELDALFENHPSATLDSDDEFAVPANALLEIIRVFGETFTGVELMDDDELRKLSALAAEHPGLLVSAKVLLDFIAVKAESSPEFASIPLPDSEPANAVEGPSTPRKPPALTVRNGLDSDNRQHSTPLSNPRNRLRGKPAPSHRRSASGSSSGLSSDSDSYMSAPASSPEPYSRPHSRAYSPMQSRFDNDQPQGYASPASPEYRERPLSFQPYYDRDRDEDVGGMNQQSPAQFASFARAQYSELQQVNVDLVKRLKEAEGTLQKKLADHDLEVEQLQTWLDEGAAALNHARRDEVESKATERQNTFQINSLEAEVAKLQEAASTGRADYQKIHKLFLDHQSEIADYKSTLRRYEQESQTHTEAAALHQLEIQSLTQSHDSQEERIAHLVDELVLAQQAFTDLENQKAINLTLQETIDRARLEVDLLRNRDLQGGGSGTSSLQGSISKSLGAELKGKLGGDHQITGLENEEGEGDDTIGEDEYYTQTIVTRKTHKRASNSSRFRVVFLSIDGSYFFQRTSARHRVDFGLEEPKEYFEASAQYDSTGFTSESSAQTEPTPHLITTPPSFLIETPPATVGMGIQTEQHTSLSTKGPSEAATPPIPNDFPPAYYKADRGWCLAVNNLRKWHQENSTALPTRLPDEAIQEWKLLQARLGIDCVVLENIIAARPVLPPLKCNRLPFTLAILLALSLLAVGVGAMMYTSRYTLRGGPTYHDRIAWTTYNNMRASREGFLPDSRTPLRKVFDGLVQPQVVYGWTT